jgi:hypothetical protein
MAQLRCGNGSFPVSRRDVRICKWKRGAEGLGHKWPNLVCCIGDFNVILYSDAQFATSPEDPVAKTPAESKMLQQTRNAKFQSLARLRLFSVVLVGTSKIGFSSVIRCAERASGNGDQAARLGAALAA